MGLVYTGTPPPWVTIDGVNNVVIARANFFTGATQAAANLAAQTALNAWVTAALANGSLTCQSAGCNGILITNTGSGASRDMVVVGSLAVTVGQSGVIRTSPDGINWTNRASGIALNLKQVAYGIGTYVALGQLGSFTSSPDGFAWTAQPSVSPTNQFNGLVFAQNQFVAGNDGGEVWISSDGITFNLAATLTQYIKNMAFGNGTYVACGQIGLVATSTDGSVWSEAFPGAGDELQAAAYGNGVFVVAGDNGAVMWSSDASVWNTVAPFTVSNIQAMGFGNGNFVLGTDNGELWVSTDGATWAQQLPVMYFFRMVRYYQDCQFITQLAT